MYRMSLEIEILAKLQKAAMQGLSLESTGIEITPEIRDTFEALKLEYANAPAGTMAHIVEDLGWGKWDSLLNATEKAWGPLFGDKPLSEQLAIRRAEVAAKREAEAKSKRAENG